MEKMILCIEVIAKLPVRLPSSYQRETRSQAYPNRMSRFVSIGFWCGDVSDFVSVVEPPNLVGKFEFYTFPRVFDFSSSWSIDNPWKLSFKRWTFIDDFVVFDDSNISPMRHLNDFFNFSKFHQRIVIDPKDCMPNNCERFQTAFVELNFSSFFASVTLMIAKLKNTY